MSDVHGADEEALANIRRLGGEALLGRMIGLFLQHSPARVAALRAALSPPDLKALSAAAHGLKSSAGNFGASDLVVVLAEIERLADAANRADYSTLVARAEELYARLCAALGALGGR